MVAPEKLMVPYLRALLPEEEDLSPNGIRLDSKKTEDEESRDRNDSLKDVQENPYIQSPKRPKMRV